MTQKTIRVLAAVVLALVLLIAVVERTDDNGPAMQERALLPGLAEHANSIQRIRVITADADPLTLRLDSGRWVNAARDDYAVDLGKLRPLIVALADARILEEKTSNPEHYGKLGVDDPEEDGSGTKITVEGEGFAYTIILGESAQGNHRYARLADEETSYLVDQNPGVPDSAADWLLSDVLDIAADKVRSVTITHADGETIAIAKESEDQTDFTVLDVPEGRELSYGTVANGIAGALGALRFDDVRKAVDGAVETSAVFETWDGLQISAQVRADGEDAWVTFSVAGEPDDTAGDIGEKLAGWQYRLPEYKKNLMTRRWDDILKAMDDD